MLIAVGKFSIYMSEIKGILLRDIKLKKKGLLKEIGSMLAHMHNADIAHGDFTPANIMVFDNKPYIIDFGLAEISRSIEEKAIDLLLMKRSLEAKQYKILEESYLKNAKKGEEIIERLKEIEKRGRYQNRSLSTEYHSSPTLLF
jgi:Kae1-associated kinase Bud32